LANELPDKDLYRLMTLMRKVWREDVWLKELPYAQAILDNARKLRVNPMAMLLWNRCHRKGGLVFRSFRQWYGAMTSEAMRATEDYLACVETPCEICQKNNYQSWTQNHPFLGVDAIHCACPEPFALADTFMCHHCLMVNHKGALEPSQEKLRLEWEEAEAKRVEKLARFEFREITDEEQKAFIAMRGEEGWTKGRLKEMTTAKTCNGVVTHPAVWDWKCARAAILWFLKLRQPVSWDNFGILVEQIAELDKPVDEPPSSASPPN
jgi:hypothetical protein